MSPVALVLVGIVIVLVLGLVIDYALSRRALARELTDTVWADRTPVLVGFDGSRDHEVFVTITADTSRFETGIRHAQGHVRALQESLRLTRIGSLLERFEVGAFDADLAMRRLDAQARVVRRPMGELVADLVRKMTRQREAKLAGLGSRFYTRGGLECRTVEQVDLLVRSILTVPNEYHAALANAPVLTLFPVTRQERCELAVEAMRGYVLHMDPWRRPDPEPPGNLYVVSWTTWHWWGGGRAVVDNVKTGRNYNGWGPIPNGMSTPPGRQGIEG